MDRYDIDAWRSPLPPTVPKFPRPSPDDCRRFRSQLGGNRTGKNNMFTSGAPAVLFLLCFAPLASTPQSLLPPNAYSPNYRIMTPWMQHNFLRLPKSGAAFSGSKPSPSCG